MRVVKKFDESETAKCRWSEFAAELIGDWDVVWENSVADYQGSAAILACNGTMFRMIEWSYGSCSGCDPWEDEPEDAVRKDFAQCMMEFKDVSILLNYLENLYSTDFNHAKELTTAVFTYAHMIEKDYIKPPVN